MGHASVILEEFGDFECPACIAAYSVLRKVREHFAGQLRFVYRNFPLREVHPHAERAAEATEAAGAQGKFWEMHDLLFTHPGQLGLPELVDFADRLGLDVERFEEELTNHSHARTVAEDVSEGARRGVDATPTLFINGRLYQGNVGVQPIVEKIQRVLDEELIRRAI